MFDFARERDAISIHAPRVGGDRENVGYVTETWEFQSTPPVWGATVELLEYIEQSVFQSTPPVWGATGPVFWACLGVPHFKPRPPCGGRPE